MREIIERIKYAAVKVGAGIASFVADTEHNPLRDSETLKREADYADRALNALADIVALRPFSKYVWNADEYRGETMTLIDARQVKDILTHHRLLEG